MPIPQAEVTRQRRAQAQIAKLVTNRLRLVFNSLPLDKPADARNMLLALVPDLVRQYGDMAASMAADAYDLWRNDSGVRGRFKAKMHPSAYMDAIPGTVRRTAADLFTDHPMTTLAALNGPVAKYVLSAGRETITRSADADPQSSGWGRDTSPGACSFCVMLTDRGATYTEASVDFAAHGDCRCSAFPSWDADVTPVSVETYKASERTSAMTPAQKAKHNADLRSWMQSNGYEPTK